MIKQISARLAQERARLKLTQAKMASYAGVVMRTYVNYEAGSREIGGGALAQLAAVGADVLYILTGERSTTALSKDERVVLEGYRALDTRGRAGVLGMISGLTTPEGGVRVQGTVGQYVEGDMKAPFTLHIGKKKKE